MANLLKGKNVRNVQSRRLCLEALENREMLSASSGNFCETLVQAPTPDIPICESYSSTEESEFDSVCSAIVDAAANALESAAFSAASSGESITVGDAVLTRMPGSADRWSVDFALDEQTRGVLFGLSYSDALGVAADPTSWETLSYFDANKPNKADDPEGYALVSKHCWSAAASNMLSYAGWTDGLSFASEQDVFDYFTSSYTNASGNASYACEWFAFGNRDRNASVLDHDAGGFYADQASARGESGADYVSWELNSFFNDRDAMNRVANSLAAGDAVGLNIDWVRNSTGAYVGGHTLTCWGYGYDPAYTTSDVEYYTSLFTSDSDDGVTKLQNYAIEWSDEAEIDGDDVISGYAFSSYSPSSTAHGFICDYVTLAAKPEKYEIETTQDVRSATPEGWDAPIVVSSDSESSRMQTLIAPGASAYVRFAFEALENAAEDFSCRLYLDGELVQNLRISGIQGGETYTNLTSDGLSFDLGVLSEGAHEVKVVFDALNEVEEYRTSNNVLLAGFNVGSNPDPYEPNNSYGSAYNLGTVAKSTTIAAVADASKKYDYYKFTLDSDATIADRLELRCANDVSDTLVLFLYDSSKKVVNQTRLCNGCAQLPLDVPAGTYYAALFNSTSTASIPYALSYLKGGADFSEKESLSCVTVDSSDPVYGETICASVGSCETASYQWYRGSEEAGWTTIEGAANASYTPTANDVGLALKVEATGVGEYCGTAIATTNATTRPLTVFVFNKAGSEPTVGVKITSYIYADAEASYQWVRVDELGNETPIEGAVECSYTPTLDDYGYYLKAYAVGESPYTGELSKQTPVVVTRPKVTSVSISGSAEYNKRLVATGSPASATVTYQWYRGSEEEGWTAIANGASRTYYATLDDVGFYLKVVATGYGDYEGVVSTTTDTIVRRPIATVALTAKVAFGVAVRTYVVPNATTAEYQWYRGSEEEGWTAIEGATEANYTPVYADSDKYLKVTVTGTGEYCGVVSKTTKTTFTTDFDALLSTDSPAYYKTLQASLSPKTATATWQWYRVDVDGTETAISGATSAKYTPKAEDVGFYLKAVAYGTGKYETAVAAVQTSNVVTRALSSIALTPNAKVGAAVRSYLTPSAGTATYEWFVGDDENGWTKIADATTDRYVPTDSDVGKRVKVAATGYGAYYGKVEKTSSVVLGAAKSSPYSGLDADVLEEELSLFFDLFHE